jgi:hypothetical protein
MKIATTILTTALLAGISSAQTAPASQVVKPNAPQTKVQTGPSSLQSPFVPKKPAKNAPETKAQPAQKPAAKQAIAKKPVVAQKAMAQKPVVAQKGAQKLTQRPMQKPAQAAANKLKIEAKPKLKAQSVAAKPVKPEVKPAETVPAQAQVAAAKPKVNPGKRDPFISPIAAAALRNGPVSCSTGKHCLVVDQIALKGIVQMKEGNFALVENAAKRPYVLRENDSLFNGSVVKITGDSVIFKENGSDILGRPTTKEVVKKVSAPAV